MISRREYTRARLEAIGATRLAIETRKASRNDAKRYTKLCRDNRRRDRKRGGEPYDIAIARIEQLTNTSASDWEHKLRHPYVRAAVKYARYLAGIPEAA